jgi:PEP-CTERM motif
MIRSAKAFVFLALLAVGGAGAATAAHAQSATSCPGGSDKNASDCLQIVQNGTQVSLLAITESDELGDPNHIWSIGGVVDTDPQFTGQWVFALTEPGSSAISDVVGVTSLNTIAFMSDAENGLTVFPPGPFLFTVPETSSPLDVSVLLSPAARDAGFKVFFQSDVEGAVPEPSTWAMLLLGFAGLGFFGYRKARPTRAFAA